MTELELLISLYLDGELTPAQAERLRKMLAESHEARATLREMRAIARSARHSPLAHVPSHATERKLFERLRAEGFGLRRNPARARRPAAAGLLSAYARRAVPALVAAVVAIVGLTWFLTSTALLEPDASSIVAASVATPPREPIRIEAPANVETRTASATRRGTRRLASQSIIPPILSALTPASDRQSTADLSGADPSLAVVPDDSIGTRSDPSPKEQSPIPLAIVLPEVEARDSDPRLEATVSAGALVIDRGHKVADGLTFGIGLAVADGHRVSVLGGRSAAVTERRATNTLSVVSRSMEDDKAGPGLLRSDGSPSPYDVAVRQEWWVGLGYAVRVWRGGPFDLDVGLRAGIGEEAWRIGGEVPVRLRLSRNISLSAAMTVAHVQPHSRALSEFGIESRPDGYLFEAEAGQTTFTTVGAELGVRIALD